MNYRFEKQMCSTGLFQDEIYEVVKMFYNNQSDIEIYYLYIVPEIVMR